MDKLIEDIQKRGVLKVGTTGDYQPMSFLDPKTGRYVGIDADLAEDLADARREQALMSDGYLQNGKTLLCRAEDADKYISLESIDQPGVRVMENPGGTNE